MHCNNLYFNNPSYFNSRVVNNNSSSLEYEEPLPKIEFLLKELDSNPGFLRFSSDLYLTTPTRTIDNNNDFIFKGAAHQRQMKTRQEVLSPVTNQMFLPLFSFEDKIKQLNESPTQSPAPSSPLQDGPTKISTVPVLSPQLTKEPLVKAHNIKKNNNNENTKPFAKIHSPKIDTKTEAKTEAKTEQVRDSEVLNKKEPTKQPETGRQTTNQTYSLRPHIQKRSIDELGGQESESNKKRMESYNQCCGVNHRTKRRCGNTCLMDYIGPRPVYCAEHIHLDPDCWYQKCAVSSFDCKQKSCKEVVLKEFGVCYKHLPGLLEVDERFTTNPSAVQNAKVILKRVTDLANQIRKEANAARAHNQELFQRKAKLVTKYHAMQDILSAHITKFQNESHEVQN
eukprot:c18461_g1_i2.p1 GENE.c18461_g1_i2~~c18461_g1_i2.p1  ORF type:complete len:403 (-),score=86.54 c18461_g1_i2:189-1376(-)